MPESTVELINSTITDLVSQFLYYDRKEDESLPVGEIEREISLGNISVDDIIDRFSHELISSLKNV